MRIKNKKNGLFIILSSPSGAGKTTIAKKLLKNNKNIELSISYTTRKKRPLEKNKRLQIYIRRRIHKVKKKKIFFRVGKGF